MLACSAIVYQYVYFLVHLITLLCILLQGREVVQTDPGDLSLFLGKKLTSISYCIPTGVLSYIVWSDDFPVGISMAVHVCFDFHELQTRAI